MRHNYNVIIQWTAFPLHPDTPQEGLTLDELFAGRPVNIKKMLDHLNDVATELGLPFGTRKKTFNSRLAQELGKFAEQRGKGEEFHNAVFRAYFADGRNIGLISTLVELGVSVGLKPEKIQYVLEHRSFKDAVDNDWERSYQLGVTAVPTFMLNGMSLVGAQPYEKLVQFMETNQIKQRL